MKAFQQVAIGILICGGVGGCATWGQSNVDVRIKGVQTYPPSDPAKIIVSEGDLTQPYEVIADVSAVANKTVVFLPNPTREHVNERLRQKAAALGADAVIFARYGQVGVSSWSWGSLEGKGRAIKFKE